jgi:hypothetical protein
MAAAQLQGSLEQQRVKVVVSTYEWLMVYVW